MREQTEGERIDELVRWLHDGTTRQIRERAGWSRERCARQIGVTDQVILRGEHGRNLPGRRAGLSFHKLLCELRDAPSAGRRDARFGNRGAQRQGAGP